MSSNTRMLTGFTLVELIVTVAIAAILMAVAMPSFKRMMSSNQVTNTYYDLIAALRTARSEAVANGALAKVQGSSNWSNGWSVLDNEDTTLREFAARDSRYKITPSPADVEEVAYNGRGTTEKDVCFEIKDNALGSNSKVVHLMVLKSGSVYTPDTCP